MAAPEADLRAFLTNCEEARGNLKVLKVLTECEPHLPEKTRANFLDYINQAAKALGVRL